MRRRWSWIVISASLLAIAGGAVWIVGERQRWIEIDQAEREMEAGRFEKARARLERLARRWIGKTESEVEFRLGVCERACGRPEEALAAWARVEPDSALAVSAARGRAEIDVELGRFTDAEKILSGAGLTTSEEGAAIRRLYLVLLAQQGRLDEARLLIESIWGRIGPEQVADRSMLLHNHLALDFEPVPLETNLREIDRLNAFRADDDRLWLARANLATRAGRFEEARKWLDDCVKARPDDPVVWRARLDWALAAGRVDEAREACAHLSARDWSAARLARLRAWLASRRSDARIEREALEEVVAVEPADTAAIGRLAELLTRAGQHDDARRLWRRKALLDESKDRYHQLFKENRLAEHAAEMARLAESLHRRFEARAFYELVFRGRPTDPAVREALTRLATADRPKAELSGSIAQVLAADFSGLTAARTDGANGQAPARLPEFEDAAPRSGLARFVLDNGLSPKHQLPEMSSGGIALLDYDGDGWLDVYAVQGGPFPDGPFAGDRLFRNRRDGTFEDVSDRAGIAAMARGYGHAAAVGDIDNDGRPDLFVTRWRSYALYHNRGDGTFEEITDRVGLSGDRDWPTSAALADLDGDGDLDLYVCHYGVWDATNPRICKDPGGTHVVSCDPRVIRSVPDHLFRNDHGRFVDVTAEAGIVDRDGRGLGVVIADLDGDHALDIFVANDSTANFLFRNRGGFRFEQVAQEAGVAANAGGGYQAGMGVACGDLDGDGLPELAVTNYYEESTTLFQNLGDGLFADRTAASGLLESSRSRLGFGIVFFDADNDGWLDVMTANGHVVDIRPVLPYAMTAQLFQGSRTGRLTDITANAGSPFQREYVGRGLASGDLDNDGRIDAVMVAQNEPLVEFHNRTAAGRALTLELEGTKSCRDAVGARVTVTAGGRSQTRWRLGGGSYASACDPRLHFGLGASTRVASVEVRWPSGRVDRFADLDADTGYHLREGDDRARRLTGFGSRSRSRD
jgi:tetratricopeptide (TPR) repeat protein